jgi:hypothetical protein
MAQFVATMGALQLEVAYFEIESWLSWSCVIRQDGEIVGSIGGISDRQWRVSDERVIENAVESAVKLKFSLNS